MALSTMNDYAVLYGMYGHLLIILLIACYCSLPNNILGATMTHYKPDIDAS